MSKRGNSLSDRGKRFWAAVRHAFAIPEERPLTEQEREWMETLAREVVRRRMADPALFLLESSRPLNYLGSQALTFFKPVISLVFDREDCDRVANLLARRGSIDTLMELIEHHRSGQEKDRDRSEDGSTSG